MAEIPDGDGGGSSGGGSTTSICTINPSDNISIVNNLISRISDIERFLSQLVGADVHADNLSELADNIGNILNGTITLPSDDNSPYGDGGSIPVPDDFTGTVISGNVLVVWENGVVSFELIPGTGITVGAGGGVTEYITAQPTTTVFAIGSVAQIDEVNSGGTALSVSNNRIKSSEPGLYQIDVVMIAVTSSGSGTSFMTVGVTNGTNPYISVRSYHPRAGAGNQGFTASFCVPARTPGADGYLSVGIGFSGCSSLETNITNMVITVTKIGD